MCSGDGTQRAVPPRLRLFSLTRRLLTLCRTGRVAKGLF
jgi:hypothetical protein